jgi:hypothetical protein
MKIFVPALQVAAAALLAMTNAQDEPICYVCGSPNRRVGNPRGVINLPDNDYGIDSATCQEIENAGLDGLLPPFACEATVDYAFLFTLTCQCEDGQPPPRAPVAAPSPALVPPVQPPAPTPNLRPPTGDTVVPCNGIVILGLICLDENFAVCNYIPEFIQTIFGVCQE